MWLDGLNPGVAITLEGVRPTPPIDGRWARLITYDEDKCLPLWSAQSGCTKSVIGHPVQETSLLKLVIVPTKWLLLNTRNQASIVLIKENASKDRTVGVLFMHECADRDIDHRLGRMTINSIPISCAGWIIRRSITRAAAIGTNLTSWVLISALDPSVVMYNKCYNSKHYIIQNGLLLPTDLTKFGNGQVTGSRMNREIWLLGKPYVDGRCF